MFIYLQSIEDGLIGESPYVGKGRFRQEMLSRQRGQGDAEIQAMQRQHEELDRELEEKKLAIEKGKTLQLCHDIGCFVHAYCCMYYFNRFLF